jgi:hypothetical protein
MSFLDKAKAKAAELAGTVKDKVDDFKEGRKVEDLLADLGRITYRQRTDATEPGDPAAIDALVSELKQLEAEGAAIAKQEPNDEPAATTPLSAPSGEVSSMPPPVPPAPPTTPA